ncbi:DNA gyrase C-terminal beta-propeller domain-containing protein, partial [Escherichia coli]
MSIFRYESILAVFPYKKIEAEKTVVFISKNGWVKQTRMTEFEPWRTYKSRPLSGMKLKSDDDELVASYLVEGQTDLDLFLVTYQGMGLRYPLEEVPVVGAKAAGVHSINLKDEDTVVNGLLVLTEGDTPIIIVTQRGAVKRMLAQEISQTSRAKRGVTVL